MTGPDDVRLAVVLVLEHEAGNIDPPVSAVYAELGRQLEGLGPIVVDHPAGAVARYRVTLEAIELA